MDGLELVKVSAALAEQIADYRAEFPAERMRVTADPDSIPGLDGLERFASVPAWLRWCGDMDGKISWFLTVRRRDGKAVGAVCLRHSLEYDEDDPEFASHIGYSVRPSERGKGCAKEQLRLALCRARACGLRRVRLVCRDSNTGSRKAILANGGVYVDTLHGEESGLDVERYDIALDGDGPPAAILVYGKLCSGKTTYTAALQARRCAVPLSVDDVMLTVVGRELGDAHDAYVRRVKDYLLHHSMSILEAGVSVILDWGFWTRAERGAVREFYRSRGIPCEAHYLCVEPAEWRRRVEERNRAVLAGRGDAYYVDENLMAKFERMFEEPARGEIDVWVEQGGSRHEP